MKTPATAYGLTLPVRLTRVIDGDTLEVMPDISYRVRLVDCWAPELSRPGGLKSQENLRQLIPPNGPLTLHVPVRGTHQFASVFTFGRILGHLYTPDGESIADLQIQSGHATRTPHR